MNKFPPKGGVYFFSRTCNRSESKVQDAGCFYNNWLMQDSIECTVTVNATEWHVHFKFERFYFERSNFNLGGDLPPFVGSLRPPSTRILAFEMELLSRMIVLSTGLLSLEVERAYVSLTFRSRIDSAGSWKWSGFRRNMSASALTIWKCHCSRKSARPTPMACWDWPETVPDATRPTT